MISLPTHRLFAGRIVHLLKHKENEVTSLPDCVWLRPLKKAQTPNEGGMLAAPMRCSWLIFCPGNSVAVNTGHVVRVRLSEDKHS